MTFQDLYYEYPHASLLILIVLLFIALFWTLYRYRQHIKEQFFSHETAEEVLNTGSTVLFIAKAFILCLAWVFAVLALMQPKNYGSYPKETLREGQNKFQNKSQPIEITLLIDLSASMDVRDMPSNKTRLEVAREIADEIVSDLTGQSVGLFGFSTDLISLSPPTTDYLYVRLMLRQLNTNATGQRGTNLKEALQQLNQYYLTQPKELLKTAILFSDGEDNSLAKDFDKIDSDVKVFVVGTGTKEGGTVPSVVYQGKPVVSRLQEDSLKLIAKQGDYFSADISNPLSIAKKIEQKLNLTKTDEGFSNSTDLVHKRFFQIPLGLAILLLGIYLAMPISLKTKYLWKNRE